MTESCPSDDFDADEFIHEVEAESEVETDNDMAELEMSFAGNKFNYHYCSSLLEALDYLQLQCSLYINGELPGISFNMQPKIASLGLVQHASMDQASAIQEFIHEVDAEYEEETDNDMAELEMSFTESTIDDQTMDKDPADFIAKEEKFNFV
ncbi:hypothetical protein DAPPUDRAFT_329264 [Daphnia pulex]|uniref:Uncharacterized protein n=1 Tax=Daphnia pulex TaxID=6669 RepID=E9HG38_DAPPU|nr:hypothetical protein DAPPUDRAFT_329264 [Daphnia pulex]|eukprot:EFX69325.1 hypothetical protein DAPPUDRAFT_329264 [Daphnia pulex]